MWHVGKVITLHDETATARTIILEVADWPGHVAGQHVDVRLTAADGYSAARSYSITSAPNFDGRIELTIERLPDGEVSPYLTQELTVGDPLELRGPLGGWFVWRAVPDILGRRIQVFERLAIVGPAPKPKNAFRLR